MLREDLFPDERRRDAPLREVRAAREVISPNVCRIFDLVEIEGRQLVSMEYVDGQTLLEVLQERGPMELKEAQEIASQFLAGLGQAAVSDLMYCSLQGLPFISTIWACREYLRKRPRVSHSAVRLCARAAVLRIRFRCGA